MPTSTNPQSTGTGTQSGANNSDARSKRRQPSGTSLDTGNAPRVSSAGTAPAKSKRASGSGRPASATGSLSASKPSGRRLDATGSLSAANPNARRKGATGSLSAANPNAKRKGATGSLSAANPNARRKGTTGSLSAANPYAKKKGATGSLSATNPGRVRTGRTGTIGYDQATGAKGEGQHFAEEMPSIGRRVLLIAGIALALVVVLAGGFFVVRTFVTPYEGARVEDGQPVTVVIAEGSDGQTIIRTLLDAGVIHNRKDFMRAVNEQNADQSLRSGTYTFLTGSDPAEVVRQLVSGPNTSEGQLQVPEGLTIQQTAQLVEESLGISANEFLQQAKASNYVNDYPFLKDVGNDSLEGFLYPKTYDFAGREATADEVIRMMLSQFESEFSMLDADAARKEIMDRYGLNALDYDFIKLASIIEKEALNEDDRAKVSSVFYNRLKISMALQSDATIGYVNGGLVDTEADSPYNTYLYKGLPPTPICSPSEWALEAALHPADTDYLFFFIIEDGDYSNHTFNETFEQHSADYSRALEELRASKGNDSTGQTD